jgi:heme oxygenase
MEFDLSAIGRSPVPMSTGCPDVDSVGALFGALYTLEGATLGGQLIAHKLPPNFPLRFFALYGDQTRQRWDEFLGLAVAECPRSEYETAAATAVALFGAFKKHLDDSQRHF